MYVLIYRYGLSFTLYVGVILVVDCAFSYINNAINKMIVIQQRYLFVLLFIEIYQLIK